MRRGSEYGHVENYKYSSETRTIDWESTVSFGMTALHCASIQGHLAIVQYLIETCQADKESRDCYARTALHRASGDGHLDIVIYLLVLSFELKFVDIDDRYNVFVVDFFKLFWLLFISIKFLYNELFMINHAF